MSFFLTPDGEPRPFRIVPAVIAALLVIYLAFGSWYTVSPTERAVVVRLGTLSEDIKTE